MEEKMLKNNSDEVSLKDLIKKINKLKRYIFSKWIIILAFSLFCAALGFAYSIYNKPVYVATTTFVLEEGEKSGGLGQYAGLASMAGIDLGGSGGGIFQGDNIIELYRSRTMVQKALLSEIDFNGKKQLLINRFLTFNKIGEKLKKNPQLRNIDFYIKPGQVFSRVQDSILGKAVLEINKNYLAVAKLDKKLSIIKVEVRAEDEAFSKIFNNQIVKNVNDFYVQTKTKKSLQTILILQQKTDSVRRNMYGAINMAASVSDATPNLNTIRQSQRAAPVQRSQISIETNKAMLGELIKNLELSKINLSKESPLIQIVDEPIYPLNKEAFGKLKGIVLGLIIGGFLAIVWLIIRKMFSDLMQ